MDNEAQVRLVFAGEVLEGFALDDVKRRVGEAFKLDDAKLSAMFSGARTVLKRALPRDEAMRYVAKLQALGARIHMEPLVAAAQPAPPPAPVLALAPVSDEEIVCPHCGERQPKRILCRSCATDMPRGIAAKLEDAERLEESRARRGLRPSAAASRRSPVADDAPPIFGFGFEGRMARVPYFIASVMSWFAIVLVAIVAAVLIPLMHGFLLTVAVALVGFVAVCVWSVRLLVLRLHDINFSGWWAVLAFIPYLGAIPCLALLFVPGSSDDNDYGGRPREGNPLVAAVLAFVIVVVLLVGWRAAWSTAKKRFAAMETAEQADAQAPAAGAPPEQLVAEYLHSAGAVNAFRNDYWGEADHKAFAASEDGAWGWRSGQTSPQRAAMRALAACEEQRKPYTRECELVNVNGAWAPR
ncbi:MAG TPA: DUF805 domain-containing protein [Albitalea sp.]|nr:DUF805 domain-containing protein [Albitalea sp.]